MEVKKIRLGSAVLVIDHDRVLLGRRNKHPDFGRWVLPGGKIEFGETHEEAAVRESKEELGIDILIERLAGKGIYHLISGDVHRVIIYSIAKVIDGSLHPSTDISEARYFSREELNDMDIPNVVRSVLVDEGWYHE